MARPLSRRACALLALLVLACAPAGAHGSTRTELRRIDVARQSGAYSEFRLRGVPVSAVTGASLRTAGTTRRLSLRALRSAAQRGTLRVKTGRSRRPTLLIRVRVPVSKAGSKAPSLATPARPASMPAAAPASGTQSAGAQPATAAASTPSASAPVAARRDRLYSETSPWNTQIATSSAVDPGSAAMVRGLVAARNRKGFPIAVREWTVPVYYADAKTPRQSVALRKALPSWTQEYGTPANFIAAPPGWATDPTQWGPRLGDWLSASHRTLASVPIPAGAEAADELDGHMTVIDSSSGCEYDFYGASKRADGSWQAAWGNTTRIDGSGVYPEGLSSKASGFAGAAGLIRPEELRAGRIDHALFLGIPNTRSGGPVAPATSSDGKTDSAEALPEGARVRLDPSIDIDSLGLEPYERTVAKAMQEYGMIVGDTGGAMSLYAEHSKSSVQNPYAGVLPNDPYAYLDKIPVSKMQVMQMPAQRSNAQLRLHPSGCGMPG